MTNSAGRVFLVGAGPGDPELITVRGRELIAQAEVIVYDHLANAVLLGWAGKHVELIYVGKQAGRHSMDQEQINQLLIEKARKGKKVVRLKGGDPYVFGRGAEEAEALEAAGIGFEVVCGVTAGISAAAYAGIPVTHRDHASEVSFITGHEDISRPDSQVDWPLLGAWRGTLVFYMGVKNLASICAKLRQHGMAGDTPAAIICHGTTGHQRTVSGTVGTLASLAERQDVTGPAVIVIGQVVRLRRQLNWFEKLPLFGKRIVVTRARQQTSELTERLLRLGADVLESPTIRITEPQDPQPLRAAVKRAGQYDWIVFTSVNGVESFFRVLRQSGYDTRQLAGTQLCAIGPATSARLEWFGVTADAVPQQYSSDGIIERLAHAKQLIGKRVLLPRGDMGGAALTAGLTKLGAQVDEVLAYRTVREKAPEEGLLDALARDEIDWITFTSPSTVRSFLEQVDLKNLFSKKLRIASIGPVTSAAIEQAGLTVDAEAQEYTIDGLVRAVVQSAGLNKSAQNGELDME